MDHRVRLLLGVLLGSAWLAGCAAEAGPALPTDASPPTALALLSATPLPTAVPVVAAPTATPYCVNDAQFVEDLSLPDGSQVLPGAAMDKRWLVLNSGECAWGPGYRLVHIGESRIAGPSELALFPAVPGAQAVWQVNMVAPSEEGEFISRWRAQAPDGTLFGDEVYVLVVVDASPLTPTPIPTAPTR